MTNFNDKVYALCKKIPKGRVSTYKEIARVMKTKAYQAVGNALRNNPFAPQVPCHRVVKTNGSIGGFGGQTKGKKIKEKVLLLEKEGVKVKNNKIIDFSKKLHRF